MEIWRTIPEFEDYKVSNLGNVKSLKFNKEKILVKVPSTVGYLVVRLYVNGASREFKVHQLVAMAFLNHAPCGYNLVVDHINNIKTDNNLENLQIVTARKNISKDKKNKSSKYTGVCWYKNLNKWLCSITVKGKRKHLGYFKNEKVAYAVYQYNLELLVSL